MEGAHLFLLSAALSPYMPHATVVQTTGSSTPMKRSRKRTSISRISITTLKAGFTEDVWLNSTENADYFVSDLRRSVGEQRPDRSPARLPGSCQNGAGQG